MGKRVPSQIQNAKACSQLTQLMGCSALPTVKVWKRSPSPMVYGLAWAEVVAGTEQVIA